MWSNSSPFSFPNNLACKRSSPVSQKNFSRAECCFDLSAGFSHRPEIGDCYLAYYEKEYNL